MAEKGTLALLLEVIKKEIGTIEGPKDNETKYGAFTKANFLPWCGSFIMWTANQAGVKVPNCVYTPAGVAAFKKAKKWLPASKNAKPKPGYVTFFDFPGGRDIDHVGWLIKDNGDGTCICAEGNTSAEGKKGSQANGGEAALRTRAYAPNKKGILVTIAGWGIMDYPDAENDESPSLEDKKVALAAVAKSQGVEVPAVKLFKAIKLGSKGSAVKTIQEGLGLTADGQFGPATEKAVKAFQTKEKLKVTGIVDEETYRRIKMG
jgi:hypothetical protein